MYSYPYSDQAGGACTGKILLFVAAKSQLNCEEKERVAGCVPMEYQELLALRTDVLPLFQTPQTVKIWQHLLLWWEVLKKKRFSTTVFPIKTHIYHVISQRLVEQRQIL